MGIEISAATRAAMDEVVAGAKSKSEKIRRLGQAKFERADIARYLEIRYQHVRNVLEQAKSKSNDTSAESNGAPPRQEWVQIGADGRIVVPAPYRKLLGVEGGDQILLLLEQDEVRLVGRNAAVRRAQELVARYVPEGTRLTEELIAERRAEAARDNHK